MCFICALDGCDLPSYKFDTEKQQQKGEERCKLYSGSMKGNEKRVAVL